MIMSTDQFLRCSVPRKVSIITEDPDPNYIYGYLSDKLRMNYDDLKSKYDIAINHIRQRIFIKGSFDDIAVLFYTLTRFGLKYESIQQSELRIDINQFFNKLK